MQATIKDALLEGQNALAALIGNSQTLLKIEQAAMIFVKSLDGGGRVFSCGNGGSMCDAMHFAEELSGRFRGDRRPLAATAMSDPSHITCTGNDYGFDDIFSRYLEAHGRKGDVLLAVSTSGTSSNILKAAAYANLHGIQVISLTGQADCLLGEKSHCHIATPGGTKYSDRVQELHIKCIHILIELIEQELLDLKY